MGLQTDFLLINGRRAGQTNSVRQSFHDISSRGLKCIKIVFWEENFLLEKIDRNCAIADLELTS